MKARLIKLSPYIVYSLLSLFILGKLLLPGRIFVLDSPLALSPDPVNRFYGLSTSPMATSASVPFDLAVYFASKVIPVWLLEKAFLFSIFFLAGVGAHRLIPSGRVGSYFAGFLYTVNPFTYVRFLAGQWSLLAAYALIPFALSDFIALLQQPCRRKAIKVAVLSTLVGVFQIHGFFLLLIAFSVTFVVHVAVTKNLTVISLPLKYVALSAVTFVGINLYWLIPAATTQGTLLSQIGTEDLLLFAPKPTSSLSTAFDIASLHGFWRGGYLYAKDLFPLWWLLFAFIMFVAVFGFVSSWKSPPSEQRSHLLVLSLSLLWVVAFSLALGVASNLTEPLFHWIWDRIPFFRGFRDSQKFVALLALTYACLGGSAVNEFTREAKGLGRLLIALVLLVPFAYSFTMFGFHGQLGTTDYPQTWYEVKEYLEMDKDDFNVLFLPWHQYMDYSWLPNRDKRLSNPAQQFLTKPVITGDNMEAGGIYSQSTNPISKYVEFLLEHRGEISNFGELLAPLNVKYVILVHEADYASYEFLNRQTDLTPIWQKENITLFQNKHSTARAYAVDSVVYIKDLENYLERSLTEDVMQHLYVLGEGTSNGDSSFQPLEVRKDSLAKYEIKGSDHKWGIFTLPQGFNTEYWRYKGEKIQARNLGFMPAFPLNSEGGILSYSRFYFIFVPAYLISLLAMVGVVLYWVVASVFFSTPTPPPG